MVVCTTTGNLRDPLEYIERPRQASTYYRYRPWHGHESASRKGPNSGVAEEEKKSHKHMPERLRVCYKCPMHACTPHKGGMSLDCKCQSYLQTSFEAYPYVRICGLAVRYYVPLWQTLPILV